MDQNPLSAQDVIRNVTVSELRAYNPSGYEGVIQSITVHELQQHNKSLYDKIVEDNKVTSVALSLGGKEEKVQISEMQGVVDKLESRIKDLEGEIETAKVSEMRTRLVAQYIPDDLRAKVMPRIGGNTEDEIKKSIETEVAYIEEMSGTKVSMGKNNPIGRNSDDPDDLKKSVLSMFGVKDEKKGE